MKVSTKKYDGLLKHCLLFCLFIVILLLFSKLTLDGVIVGAIAMFLYEKGRIEK